MSFVQTIGINVSDLRETRALMNEWDRTEKGKAPGYVSYRLLEDREQANRYLIYVEFTSADEAAKNNDRPETAAWAESLGKLTAQPPDFVSYNDITNVSD